MSITKQQLSEILTIYNRLVVLKRTARERIQEKCAWSKPTFNRMIKWPTKMSEAQYNACIEVLQACKETEESLTTEIAKA